MSFGTLALTALALGSPPAPGGPAATVTTKYKLEIKAETTLDLSAFGQGVQIQTANFTTWLSVTLSDTAGGKNLHVLVDSAAFDGTAPMAPESVDSVKRAVVRGFVDASGRVKNLSSTPGNSLLVGQVQGMINSFFPKLKTAAKAGDSWIDTTEIKNAAGGNNTTVTLVTSYTAGERETVAGVPAIRLSAATQAAVTGTLESPQAGTMEVEGTGSGTGTLYIGAGGRFLGGNSASKLDQMVKISMAPSPIPVKTAQTVVITVLP